MPSFSYLFERFPSFTQTFCVREVAELIAEKINPAVYSIRGADEGGSCPPEVAERVRYLPTEEELKTAVRQARAEHKIHSDVWQVFNEWKDRGDKMRLYEAAWLGLELRRRGVRHVHAHFAGIAARTAYWLKKFWRITYSFTGHANDIFCETDFPVSLADLVREARFVVTASDYSRDWLREKFPADARRIERCYNGVDFSRFTPGEAAPGAPRLVSVGRYIEKKGFEDLIEACALLRDRNTAFTCDIAGSGPLQEALQERIDRLRLGDRVRLTGALAQAEVIALLREATVFVLPCVLERDGGRDNLPTVIMEASACGLAVVSTRVAGVPEMVLHEKTGLLVEEHAPAQVAAAIQRFLEKPADAVAFGRAGRELALARFSIGVTARHLKHLLVARGRVIPPTTALAHDPALLSRLFQRLTGCCQ